jgi:hypothetical protein
MSDRSIQYPTLPPHLDRTPSRNGPDSLPGELPLLNPDEVDEPRVKEALSEWGKEQTLDGIQPDNLEIWASGNRRSQPRFL